MVTSRNKLKMVTKNPTKPNKTQFYKNKYIHTPALYGATLYGLIWVYKNLKIAKKY